MTALRALVGLVVTGVPLSVWLLARATVDPPRPMAELVAEARARMETRP